MNAFIKYLGKKIAADRRFRIVNEEKYFFRVEQSIMSLVARSMYLENASVEGDIEKITEESE